MFKNVLKSKISRQSKMGPKSSKPLVSKDEPYVIIPENQQDVEEYLEDEKQAEGEDLQEPTGKVVLGI